MINLIVRQVTLRTDMSLLNFSLASADNGILLCPTCHAEFDRFDDPGFIFLPVDIPFFIEFEPQDRGEQWRKRTGRLFAAKYLQTLCM